MLDKLLCFAIEFGKRLAWTERVRGDPAQAFPTEVSHNELELL